MNPIIEKLKELTAGAKTKRSEEDILFEKKRLVMEEARFQEEAAKLCEHIDEKLLAAAGARLEYLDLVRVSSHDRSKISRTHQIAVGLLEERGYPVEIAEGSTCDHNGYDYTIYLLRISWKS